MRQNLPVYILAGGQSRRFGSDKALALLLGEPILLRLIKAVTPVASRITVVADRPGKYDVFGIRSIGDICLGKGPLGGLATALNDLSEPWMLLLSCDLVVVRPKWVHLLQEHCRPDVLAVAFRHQVWEPLLALYSSEMGPIVKAHLQSGNSSLKRLLDQIPARAVPVPEDWPPIVQINTHADLRRAEQWLKEYKSTE